MELWHWYTATALIKPIELRVMMSKVYCMKIINVWYIPDCKEVPKMKCRLWQRNPTELQMTHLTTLKKARKKGTNLNNSGNSDLTEKLRVKDRLQPTRLLCPWDFPGKSTGVGCHCLLQKMKSTVHKCCMLVGKFLSQSGMGSEILKLRYMCTRVEQVNIL